MHQKIFLFNCIFLFLIMSVVAASKIWISAPNASLKADKTASSQTIASLPVGTELNVISSEEKWYEVSTNTNEKGWIYRGKVTENPPDKNDSAKTENLLGDPSVSGIVLAAADTSRSIRGLKSKDRNVTTNTGSDNVYWKALNRIFSFYTSQQEIEEFLKEGGIGEYAQ